MISRRQLFYFSFLIPFFYRSATSISLSLANDKKVGNQFPLTLELLKISYWEEITAKKQYDLYAQKALSEDYPNIAYLFTAISISEKIHANNYLDIITSLSSSMEEKEISLSTDTTKSNLKNAAVRELIKIEEFYPDVLEKLSKEAHEKAIITCSYSWKSHKQHEKILKAIKKHAGMFFKPLAKKIEGMNPNYYVCGICGSTLDEEPSLACPICNHPVSHYRKIAVPNLTTS